MSDATTLKDDFELASVAKAHRVPIAFTSLLTLLHAAAMVLLGHPSIALGWTLVMLPVDVLVYVGIGAAISGESLDRRRATTVIASLSALRYAVVLSSPVLACWAQPGVGEAIFLCLNVAIVLAAALTQSGYVTKVALASAAPALLLVVAGLAPFFGRTQGPGILIGLLIFIAVSLGALKGTAAFAVERATLRRDRQRFVAELITANAAADAARQEAEAAVEAKSIFLATLSHEIRTPLNGILGLSHILQQGFLSPDQRENLNAVASAGAMLQSILNDVLDAGKIEAGKMELAPVATDLPALISETARFWRAPVEAKGLTLEVETPPTDQLALIDPVRLQQVLFNLISNAIKFTSQGVIRISMSLSSSGDGLPRATITVSDTGVGMSSEAQGRLFGQFNQADPTIAGKYGGSGVGLYVCRNLVTLMGGLITVESRLNEGSSFRVELPWCVAEALVDVEAAESARLKILAVDDNPTNRRVVLLLLEALGHTCRTEPSGEAALEALAVETFDLVLLDLRMPGLNGEQTLERIRECERQPRIPVFALTADAVGWSPETARASGFDGFVAKPIEIAHLVAALADVPSLSSIDPLMSPGPVPEVSAGDFSLLNHQTSPAA